MKFKTGLYYLPVAVSILLFTLIVIEPAYAQTGTRESGKSVDTTKTSDKSAKTDEDKSSRKLIDAKQGGAGGYRVLKVYERSTGVNEGSLGDYIVVEVESLQSFINENSSKNKNIILYINGLPIKGSYPIPIKDSLGRISKLEFTLNRSSASKEVWDVLLRRPDIEDRSDKKVTVSIGLEDDTDLFADKDNFNLVIIKESTIYIFAIGLLLLFTATIALGIKTNLLREQVILSAEVGRKPYSLALVQLAFWSFLIIASYFAIYIVTSEFPPITGSVLTLIGISSGTALGSVLINYSKFTEAETADNKIAAEKTVLKLRIEEIEELLSSKTKPVNSIELKNEMEMKEIRYYELSKTQPLIPTDIMRTSRGFWRDILSDSNGISLYRFQIAVWTLIIGFIFIIDVYNTLSMPQFDNTLLALMGISSGTYLGFKFPEKIQ